MDPALIRELKSLLGPENVLSQKEDLLLYEFDGSVEKGRPEVIVFPHTSEHVSGIVKLAAKYQVPVVGRGAGTGLSGGALARRGGVMIVFARMNRILELDLECQLRSFGYPCRIASGRQFLAQYSLVDSYLLSRDRVNGKNQRSAIR
jgi:hypothetical protein